MEEWKPVPGYEGIYQVSSIGRVQRIIPGPGRARSGQFMSPGRNPKGYQSVNLTKDRKVRTWPIHKMVCVTWHGPKPSPSHQAAHRDDDKENNTPGNLYWATPLENHADRRRNKGTPQGERCGTSKLRETDIPVIRKLAADGDSCSSIGDRFGVARNTISRILTGERWGHTQPAKG